MATTNAFCLASPPLVRICLHGDLQRFGRRISLYVNTAAEAIRALSQQVPGFRCQMNEGWYQIRIAGEDTAPDQISPRLHEPLNPGMSFIWFPGQKVPKVAECFRPCLALRWLRQLSGCRVSVLQPATSCFPWALQWHWVVWPRCWPRRQRRRSTKVRITVNRTRIFRHWTT